MTKVYLVVEEDWEIHVVLHATLDEDFAHRKAKELDAPLAERRAKNPHGAICSVAVEVHELEKG